MKVLTAAIAGLCFTAGALGAQAPAKDPDKTVADGGVKMAGWTGRIDPQAAKAGKNISEAKFAEIAEVTKSGCPVSKVLNAKISLSAKLV